MTLPDVSIVNVTSPSIRMLVDLYRQGPLPLDAFVSETIGIDDVEAAFTKMHHGDVLRSVVLF